MGTCIDNINLDNIGFLNDVIYIEVISIKISL